MRAQIIGALLALGFLPGAALAERHKHGKPPVEGVLNVNRASSAELMLLPGIGRGRADAIVARRQVKPFASLEEVARIKGLRKIVQRLRGHLAVDGPTTLHPLVKPETKAEAREASAAPPVKLAEAPR